MICEYFFCFILFCFLHYHVQGCAAHLSYICNEDMFLWKIGVMILNFWYWLHLMQFWCRFDYEVGWITFPGCDKSTLPFLYFHMLIPSTHLQDDVLENSFNVLRMFVRIYGTSAPTMLVSMLSCQSWTLSIFCFVVRSGMLFFFNGLIFGKVTEIFILF